jgi:hypothetical protein
MASTSKLRQKRTLSVTRVGHAHTLLVHLPTPPHKTSKEARSFLVQDQSAGKLRRKRPSRVARVAFAHTLLVLRPTQKPARTLFGLKHNDGDTAALMGRNVNNVGRSPTQTPNMISSALTGRNFRPMAGDATRGIGHRAGSVGHGTIQRSKFAFSEASRLRYFRKSRINNRESRPLLPFRQLLLFKRNLH